MMYSATPESRGIPSAALEAYLRSLEEAHLAMHDVLVARGDAIVLEKYYPPFTEDRQHRLYSVTKSFVGIAVGFALEDGLLSLDDPVTKYFSKELEGQTDENMRSQTIRDMIMMATAKPCANWFTARTDDRVRFYFQNTRKETRKPGTSFEYDSTGTFVVGALIERLTGKPLMTYLREKMFDPIGIDHEVRCLSCPGGHAWSDSAMLMRPRDLMTSARFMLNGGSWEGKQILDKDYAKEAVSCQIGLPYEDLCEKGYGYYIWKTEGDGFFFNGMGCQFAVCLPEKDLILVVNADNQGRRKAGDVIINGFFRIVADAVQTETLPENPTAAASLAAYAGTLKLFSAYGDTDSPLAAEISGKPYVLSENPMGITRLSLSFGKSGGVLSYTNAQGDKELPFGLACNVFGDFPEEGYSDLVGSQKGSRLYHCAASAAWKDASTLWMKVQIIDDYFGNMDAVFSFADNGQTLSLTMTKTAEDFLNEYQGKAEGHLL